MPDNPETPAYQEQPSDIARGWIRRAVNDIVQTTDGPDGFTSQPVYPGDPWPEQVPNALPALKAAILVRAYALEAWREAVKAARGAGHSWEELGPLIVTENELDGRPEAVAAFEAAAEKPDRFGQFPALYWRCYTCQKWITDRGPYDSHPRDNEDGHTDDCTRFAAEVAAWEQRHPD